MTSVRGTESFAAFIEFYVAKKKKRGSVKENDVIYEGMSGNSTHYYAYSVKWSPDDK